MQLAWLIAKAVNLACMPVGQTCNRGSRSFGGRLNCPACERMSTVPQDKLEQKRHFQAAGVPVADFMGVEDAAAAQRAAQAFGFPFFLKSRR